MGRAKAATVTEKCMPMRTWRLFSPVPDRDRFMAILRAKRDLTVQ